MANGAGCLLRSRCSKQARATPRRSRRSCALPGLPSPMGQDALNGFQALLEKVICGSKSSMTTMTEPCCCQEYVEQP